MAAQLGAATIDGRVGESPPDGLMYSALSPGPFKIRLLQMYPGENDDQIHCDLHVVVFNDRPPYHALSYTWGDGQASMPMRIGNVEVPIQQNLDRALRNLRKDISNQFIWIDAVCINQNDLKEKSEQVQHMAQIYQEAQTAIVWLGEADDSFKAVRDFLVQLNHEITASRESSSKASSEQKVSIMKNTQSFLDGQTYLSVLRKQSRPTVVIQKLAELLRRPYWERVWIIQEIAMAPKVQVKFGHFLVPLYPILLVSKNLSELPERFRVLTSAIIRFRAQEQGYGESSKTAPMPLLDALIISRCSLATDPRDKIYALLGMTNDGSKLVPLLTYEDSVRDVFCRLTTSLIRAKQASNVLHLAHWSPMKEVEPDLPKWSVDWAQLGYHLPPWLVKTTKSSREAISASPEFDGSVLVVKGRHLARLAGVEGRDGSDDERAENTPRYSPVNRARRGALAAKVMTQISSDLRSSFESGVMPFGITQLEITGALSRMIRDVSKGNVSLDYDPLSRDMWKSLHDLGLMCWDGRPLWSWAKAYHTFLDSSEGGGGKGRISPPASPQNPDPGQPSSSENYRAARRKQSLAPSTGGKVRQDKPRRFVHHLASVVRPSSRSPIQRLEVSDTPPQTVPDTPKLTAPPRNAFRFWIDLFSRLEVKPEHQLHFAQAQLPSASSPDRLVLVCNDAEVGDVIARIQSSKLPVVLRQVSGTYYLIGEACLGQMSGGEWTRSFREGNDDPFQSQDVISGSDDQLRIHLDEIPPRPTAYYGMFDEE